MAYICLARSGCWLVPAIYTFHSENKVNYLSPSEICHFFLIFLAIEEVNLCYFVQPCILIKKYLKTSHLKRRPYERYLITVHSRKLAGPWNATGDVYKYNT
ncbi:hypothetical protein ILUMI_06869 [Ignelater luminosus]|uniref:Uncharacterized protein n=1 Tax=Ignelater luminosus TaxID=2038154 RepID=A0A8K0DEM3_IGNLU|nr:hypothetical protein ILUMI_06869 [Ignelater luminosus]